MNIYNNPLQRITQLNPGQFNRSAFKKDMESENFTVAGEILEMYQRLKGNPNPLTDGLRFEVLKVMASYLYPKPTLNITVTPGEVAAIPPELENKSSAELKALLPSAVNG